VKIALPAAPLVEISAGRSDLDPRTANVSPRGHAGALFRDYQTASPLALVAARFDLAFVLVFLVPILIIALGYNLLAEERDRGIDRLLLVHGISSWDLALGRMLVRGALLSIPIVAAFAAVWLPVAGADRGARITISLVAVIGYMALWWGIALAMATAKLRESTTLLALLGIWIALALLIPAAVGAIAKTADPPPSRFELIAAARAAEVRASIQAAELVGGYVHDHPELERAPPDSPVPRFGERGKRWFVIARETDRALAPILNGFDAALAEQRATARRLRLISPPLTLHSTLSQLAGTDETRALAFRAQARAFQERLRDDLGHRTMAHGQLTPKELAGLPDLEFLESSTVDEVRAASVPIVVLWLLALGTVARRRVSRSAVFEGKRERREHAPRGE
jgi:ABC-2 type transport system permease protein